VQRRTKFRCRLSKEHKLLGHFSVILWSLKLENDRVWLLLTPLLATGTKIAIFKLLRGIILEIAGSTKVKTSRRVGKTCTRFLLNVVMPGRIYIKPIGIFHFLIYEVSMYFDSEKIKLEILMDFHVFSPLY
jgi:hypothetical protein